MPQLHFSVSDETAHSLRRRARAAGLSLSKYLATIARNEVADTWPKGFLDSIVGCCADDPLPDPADLPVDEVAL